MDTHHVQMSTSESQSSGSCGVSTPSSSSLSTALYDLEHSDSRHSTSDDFDTEFSDWDSVADDNDPDDPHSDNTDPDDSDPDNSGQDSSSDSDENDPDNTGTDGTDDEDTDDEDSDEDSDPSNTDPEDTDPDDSDSDSDHSDAESVASTITLAEETLDDSDVWIYWFESLSPETQYKVIVPLLMFSELASIAAIMALQAEVTTMMHMLTAPIPFSTMISSLPFRYLRFTPRILLTCMTFELTWNHDWRQRLWDAAAPEDYPEWFPFPIFYFHFKVLGYWKQMYRMILDCFVAILVFHLMVYGPDVLMQINGWSR